MNVDDSLVRKVRRQCEDFSLDEQFNEINGGRKGGFNGVTLITPNQIASRFNDILTEYRDGLSEHDYNRELMQKIIYGKSFNGSFNGQDIEIKYVNFNANNNSFQIAMIVIPSEISSRQLDSLKEFNSHIKRLQSIKANKIKLYVHIKYINDYNNYKSYPDLESLDNIFDELIINNSLDYYEEHNLIGYPHKSNTIVSIKH